MSRIVSKLPPNVSKIFTNEGDKILQSLIRNKRRLRKSRERQFKASPFTPNLEHRIPQPYVALSARVYWGDISDTFWRLLPEIYGWIESNGLASAGAPFVRYLAFYHGKEPYDDEGARVADHVIEVGVPVTQSVLGNGRFQAGTIPSGRYAFMRCSDLVARETSSKLLVWAEMNGFKNQSDRESNITTWCGRFEYYLTKQTEERERRKRQFEIAILLAEAVTE